MSLDIRGSLKNTKLSTNTYVVLEELFSNAIDAFLIRKSTDATAARLEVSFDVTLRSITLTNDIFDLEITCEDNGSGFGADQTKAFLTKDTSYKDDLAIAGIGQCKGSGRIQYFHHFSKVRVESVFFEDDQYFSRAMEYTDGQKELSPENFVTKKASKLRVGSQITLSGLKDNTRARVFSGEHLLELFSAKRLKNHLLLSFMRRLLGLRNELGAFIIHFNVVVKKQAEPESRDEAKLTAEDIPEPTTFCSVKVYNTDPGSKSRLGTFETLTISHYKLAAAQFDLPANAIALCAKSTPVKSITERYLRPRQVANNPLGGFYHVVLVEGQILDAKVNEQRDDFDIPAELDAELFRTDKISLEQIYDAIDDIINGYIAPPNWSKEQIVQVASVKYGISDSMLTDTDTRVRFGDTPSSLAKRVLSKYQERALDDTAKIFDLKEELLKLEPDSEAFRQKINDLSWQHTASFKSIDMANLSQLVVRRAAIVEVLDLAQKRSLKSQADAVGQRRKDERIIHSIFFPMRKDSTQTTDHDIWLLSEEYQYFDYIASDIPLSKLKWSDDQNLFEEDTDAALAAVMKKNVEDNAAKRPDIAIFNKEGAAIIIEFKSPGESLDNHVPDLMEYSQLLAAKSKGRLKKFYGYLIGDTVNINRLLNYERFPTGRGFFNTQAIKEHNTGGVLGELYTEILYYEDIVSRAEERLKVYKDRLKLKW